ncbi:MAG: PP2C family protein-serine/threonine phosphatase [Vicinamibacteria bacterium]|nr:PP2C family protein-serine/threonine phosphatase [Vicinamibacteria bacterium]
MPQNNPPLNPAGETTPKGATGESGSSEVQRLRIQVRRLERLVEAGKALNATLDLGDLFGVILSIVTEQTGAERASLFLLDAQRQELWSLVAQGLGRVEIRLPAGKGLAGSVAQSGETLHIQDAYADSRFDRSVDMASGYRTRNLLVAPVRDKEGRITGVIQLLNKAGEGFGQDDIDFLHDISVPAAIALDNARLHQESLVRQRLEKDLQLARTIQRSLLPEQPPQVNGFEIAVRYEASQQVGGDYYDFIRLSTDTLMVVVADVEGKGTASAMVMSNVQATLHTLARHVHSLEGILFNLNERVIESTRSGKYMTMFLGLIDVPRRGLHYINAGHVAPLLVSESGVTPLKEGSSVVGLLPGARYRRGHVKLAPGDIVVACTDGITEAAGSSEEEYGGERLGREVWTRRAQSASSIVDEIFTEIQEYSRNATHPDDKILMALKVQ